MPSYVLLTKYASDAIVEPEEFTKLNALVRKRVKEECPDVEWLHRYILLGRYDSLEIFRAPDNVRASQVAMIVRSFGHATTEVLPATPWAEMQQVLADMNPEAEETSSLGGHLTGHEDAEEAIVDEVDEAMVESFPASDPPGYTQGETERNV